MIKLLILKERFLGGNPCPFYSFYFHFLTVFHSIKKAREKEKKYKEEISREHRKKNKNKRKLGTMAKRHSNTARGVPSLQIKENWCLVDTVVQLGAATGYGQGFSTAVSIHFPYLFLLL